MKQNSISTKDLLYIEDAFSWNMNMYNKVNHYISLIDDENLIKELETVNKNHLKICKKLQSLTGGSNE